MSQPEQKRFDFFVVFVILAILVLAAGVVYNAVRLRSYLARPSVPPSQLKTVGPIVLPHSLADDPVESQLDGSQYAERLRPAQAVPEEPTGPKPESPTEEEPEQTSAEE